MVDLEQILPALSEAGVEFIIVGGVAAIVHGSARLTQDLDIAGPLDVLGEIAGGGTYESLISHSRQLSVFGIECYCLGLDRLIQAKRDAGRPKDLEAIAELESLREE